ncbi:MAG: hypothetical protein AB7I19_12915 [Planctomycetota bacterium]
MRSSGLINLSRILSVLAAVFVIAAADVSAQGCNSSITFTGQPRLGARVTMTISGSAQCHSCLWISKNPGPIQIGSVVVPIGVPLLNALDYGQLPASGSINVPIVIPTNPNTVGLTLYFTNVSFPSAQGPTLSNVVFSPAASLTIVP